MSAYAQDFAKSRKFIMSFQLFTSPKQEFNQLNKLKSHFVQLHTCSWNTGIVIRDTFRVQRVSFFLRLIFSYRTSAARISKSIRLHPRTPLQQAADWIEYTQAQGGLARLRPRGLDLPFYQLYLLDVVFVAILLLIGGFAVVRLLITCVFRTCFEATPSKEKSH